MKFSKILIIFTTMALLLISSCAHQGKISNSAISNPDLQLLASWMTGSFSSEKQAETDPDYFDIRLHMSRIWPDRCDGCWLYVEQAVAGMPPYRQRVYRVTQIGPALFESKVYSLDNPLQYAGEWEKDEPMSQLTPEKLLDLGGCEIVLKKKNDTTFVGNTIGQECKSSLRDAAYATSEVNIKMEKLVSWDRGFDQDGKQVWGAEKGGYIFDKLKDFPL